MALVSHPAMYHKPGALDPHVNGASSAGSSGSLKGASAKLGTPNGAILHPAVAGTNGLANGNGALGSATSAASNAILAAAQPYYHGPVSPQEFQPDRPIGYGAFGVVW